MDKKSIFFLGVSILILAVMLYWVGIDNVINALKMAKLELIVLAILVQVAVYLMYNLRWNILNNSANLNVSFKKLLPMTLVGLAINNITPSGRGGGEPVRAYILAREEGYNMEETFAAVVADRALDTFPFIILAIVTIIGATFYFDIDSWLLVVMVLAVIAIVVILILLIYMCINPNFGFRLEGWILGIVKRFSKKNQENLESRVHSIIEGFQSTIKMLLSNKKTLVITLALSFFIWALEISRVYFVFLAFGANINPIIIAEVFIIASLVGMIPLLPGGLGAVDGIMVLFYSAAGISSSLSAAATVIERLISFWLATILGMIILPYYGASVLDKISLGSNSDDDEEISDGDKKEIEAKNDE